MALTTEANAYTLNSLEHSKSRLVDILDALRGSIPTAAGGSTKDLGPAVTFGGIIGNLETEAYFLRERATEVAELVNELYSVVSVLADDRGPKETASAQPR